MPNEIHSYRACPRGTRLAYTRSHGHGRIERHAQES